MPFPVFMSVKFCLNDVRELLHEVESILTGDLSDADFQQFLSDEEVKAFYCRIRLIGLQIAELWTPKLEAWRKGEEEAWDRQEQQWDATRQS